MISIYFIIAYVCIFARADIDNNLIPDRDLPLCDDLLRKASRSKSHTPSPMHTKDLQGRWVSKSCETRPGPEYVTRLYKFDTEGNFKAILHQYTNESCQEALYSLSVGGKVKVSHSSFVTPGGTEADYLINSIHVVPHCEYGQIVLKETITKIRTCAHSGNKLLPLHESTILYEATDSTNKTDCGKILSWNELQLLRLEVRKTGRCRKKMLFMGDLHTIQSKQDEYRPTAYQEPLINKKCLFGCEVCKTILFSSSESPPLLEKSDEVTINLDLDGHWSSYQCEVQRYGMFLTRKLGFDSFDNTWTLEQHYFADPKCKMPVYKIFGSGNIVIHYNETKPRNVDFNITQIELRADTDVFAQQLNTLPEGRCGDGIWTKWVRKSLIPTGGCRAIGVVVPTFQGEIIKQTINKKNIQLLYLGQTPTIHVKENSNTRPTSWNWALKKCKQTPPSIEDNTINYISGLKAALASSGLTASPFPCIYLFVVILTFFAPR